MKQTLFGKAAELFRASRRRKRLHRVVAGMSALVLVATSYTLILPGTTMESDGLVCGMEEHTHTDDCYESRLICTLEETAGHVHTDACYPVEYVCGQEESAGHTHSDACYEAVPTLVCGQEESEGHTHGEGCCDAEGNLICTLAEEAGHTHTDACYEAVPTLVCGREESAAHTHTDDCLGPRSGEPACGLEEGAAEADGHIHTDACYEKVLVCQLPEHVHSAECYAQEEPAEEPETACTMEEHTHTDDCYDEEGNLICTLPEHIHSAECYAQEEPEEEPETACTMEEHTHTDACYDEEGNLICTLPEHVHDESCYAAEIPEEDVPMDAFPEELPEGYTEYTFEDEESGLSVLVYAPEGAFGDRSVALFAQVLAEDSDAYAKAQANLDSAGDAPEYDGMAALDIRFVDAGAQDPAQAEEIEPDASLGQVFVKIDAKALLPGNVDESTLAVQHHREETASDDEAQEPGVVVETVADSSETTGQVALTGSREALAQAEEPEPANSNAAGGLETDSEENAVQPPAMDLEAAFAVDSFSTYTVTWSTSNGPVGKEYIVSEELFNTPHGTYYWEFYHQARSDGGETAYSTMYVIAMNGSQQFDEGLWNHILQQENIAQLTPDLKTVYNKGVSVTDNGVSATVWKVRSTSQFRRHYMDQYAVPSGQEQTRLILVRSPGDVEAGISAEVPKINLTTTLPQPAIATASDCLEWHSQTADEHYRVNVYRYLATDGPVPNQAKEPVGTTYFRPSEEKTTIDLSIQAPIYFTDEIEQFQVEGYRLSNVVVKIFTQLKGGSYYGFETYEKVQWLRSSTQQNNFWSVTFMYGENETLTKLNAAYNVTPEIPHEKKMMVWLFYEPVEEATSALSITDHIADTGCLRAQFDHTQWEGSGQAPNLDSGEYYYKWLRKGPGDTDFREVGGEISDSIEVYYDGARATYQVELWNVNDDSDPVAVSYEYQVPYYDQLQNGGFEDALVKTDELERSRSPYYTDFANGLDPNMVWKSTGEGKGFDEIQGVRITLDGCDIEIANTTLKSPNGKDIATFQAYGVDMARDGTQFAELNCCTPGALYQDVMTIPGEPLYWWCSHQARVEGDHPVKLPPGSPGSDTMYVIIMDARDAEKFTTQEQIDEILTAAKVQGIAAMQSSTVALNVGREVTVDNVTATVWKLTSGYNRWYDYMDSYTVPDEQYLTRFFFSSGNRNEVCYLNRGMGNLLDRVGFSQTYDPGDPDTGTIVVEKTVTGLTAGTEIPAKSFEFTIQSEDGTTKTVELPLQESTVPASGILAMNSAVTGLPAGNYEVTETQPGSLAGYSYESTSVQVNGGYKPGPLTTGAFALQNGKQVRVKFTNQYELSTGSLSLTKYVESNSESNYTTADSFTFRLTYDELEDGNAFDVTYSDSDSTSAGKLTAQTAGGETYLELTLKQNQTATIEGLPADTTVTVSEPDHDGYVVKWTVNESETPSSTGEITAVIDKDQMVTVVCTNVMSSVTLPETGGPGIGQFMGLGTVLTLGAGLLLLRSRRRKGEGAC